MRERVKSGVLFFLVILSVFLTGQLLFGRPALETAAPPAYEQLTFGELRPLSEQILPQLRLGEGETWQLFEPWDSGYSKAWELFIDVIRYSGAPLSGEYPEETTGQAAHAVFAMPVQLGWWLPSSRTAEMYVQEVTWFATDAAAIWLKDGENVWHKAQLSRLPEGWEEQLIEAFAAAPLYQQLPVEQWLPLEANPGKTIFIPRELPQLAPFSLKKETMDLDKLLRSIFVNTALMRRIEERDGAVIYTDGQRGMRLFDHGELEYTSPKSEPGLEMMELAQALRRAAQYLQLMGGWPEHVYIQEFFAHQGFFQNTFRITYQSVQSGIPLMAAEAPLELHFSDRGVIDYNRQIILLNNPIGTEKILIDPRIAAVDVAAILATSEAAVQLLDVSLAYYTVGWPGIQATAQPVWVFQFDTGQVLLVHGHTGQIM